MANSAYVAATAYLVVDASVSDACARSMSKGVTSDQSTPSCTRHANRSHIHRGPGLTVEQVEQRPRPDSLQA